MSIATLLKYLVGSRAAILRIVNTPSAIWLGALLVVSAGLAREYDAKDLTREPWYLLVPLGASLVTSFLLFTLVYLVARKRNANHRPFWPTYRPFLALYWLTAPLAWLYAIPFDRVLPAAEATGANLALLGIVSLWRVSVMTRVVMVYFGAGPIAAATLVMLFGDSVAMAVLYFTPLPIFNIMGGIPLSESEQLIQGAALWVGCLGLPSWPVWLIAVAVVAMGGKTWQNPLMSENATERVAPTLWLLPAAVILGFASILPFTQAEQRLRHDVETAFAENRTQDAIDTMSRHEQADFPPHWDPPPWLAYPDPRPPLIDTLEVVFDRDTPDWVQRTYLDKLRLKLRNGRFLHSLKRREDENERVLRLLERVPLTDQLGDELELMWSYDDDPDRKQRVAALLRSLGREPSDPSPARADEFEEGPAPLPHDQ